MKFDGEFKARFLDMVSQGVPITRICKALGVAPATFYQQRIKDEEFRRKIEEVKAQDIARKLQKLNEMAEVKNDWTALKWQLQTQYPEDFGTINRLEVQATVKHQDMDKVKLAEAWGSELGILPQTLLDGPLSTLGHQETLSLDEPQSNQSSPED